MEKIYYMNIQHTEKEYTGSRKATEAREDHGVYVYICVNV
jgi:hypothetical protein